MPIYDYLCQKCDHELEVMQKLSDEPLTQCPKCGEKTLKKKLTAAGFHLKGGGWYATDFKGDKKQPAELSQQESGSKPTSHDCGAGSCPNCN